MRPRRPLHPRDPAAARFAWVARLAWVEFVILRKAACLLAMVLAGATGPRAVADELPTSVDVVVYGGTPSGVAAASNAGRQGLNVVLVEETYQVGGMSSGGLAHTDFRTFQSLGGSWKEFMDRVQDHYKTTYGENSPQHRESSRGGYYEPHVARDAFKGLLESAGVTVLLNHQLAAAEQTGQRVVSATFVPTDASKGYPQPSDGPEVRLQATVFIDLTSPCHLAN